MISLQQQDCEHFEQCRDGRIPAILCDACPRKMAKRHEPAAELGAGWALQQVQGPLVGGGSGHD